jgi:hypothetical protein
LHFFKLHLPSQITYSSSKRIITTYSCLKWINENETNFCIMNLKQYFAFSASFFMQFTLTFSQLGVGVSSPHPSAIVDITSSNKGLLIPRMTAYPSSPAVGLLVYRTDLSGFYSWNGTTWSQAPFGSNGNFYNTDGALTANRTVTQGASNLIFASTTGNLIFSPSSTGQVGIGTSSPAAMLDLNGTLRVRNVPAGSALTSLKPLLIDASGNVFTNPSGNRQLIDIKCSSKSGSATSIGSSGGWSTTTTFELNLSTIPTISIPLNTTGIITVNYGSWGDNFGGGTGGTVNPGLVVESSTDEGLTWSVLNKLATSYQNSGSSVRWSLSFSSIYTVTAGPARSVKFRLKGFNPDAVTNTQFIDWYINAGFIGDY